MVRVSESKQRPSQGRGPSILECCQGFVVPAGDWLHSNSGGSIASSSSRLNALRRLATVRFQVQKQPTSPLDVTSNNSSPSNLNKPTEKKPPISRATVEPSVKEPISINPVSFLHLLVQLIPVQRRQDAARGGYDCCRQQRAEQERRLCSHSV